MVFNFDTKAKINTMTETITASPTKNTKSNETYILHDADENLDYTFSDLEDNHNPYFAENFEQDQPGFENDLELNFQIQDEELETEDDQENVSFMIPSGFDYVTSGSGEFLYKDGEPEFHVRDPEMGYMRPLSELLQGPDLPAYKKAMQEALQTGWSIQWFQPTESGEQYITYYNFKTNSATTYVSKIETNFTHDPKEDSEQEDLIADKETVSAQDNFEETEPENTVNFFEFAQEAAQETKQEVEQETEQENEVKSENEIRENITPESLQTSNQITSEIIKSPSYIPIPEGIPAQIPIAETQIKILTKEENSIYSPAAIEPATAATEEITQIIQEESQPQIKLEQIETSGKPIIEDPEQSLYIQEYIHIAAETGISLASSPVEISPHAAETNVYKNEVSQTEQLEQTISAIAETAPVEKTASNIKALNIKESSAEEMVTIIAPQTIIRREKPESATKQVAADKQEINAATKLTEIVFAKTEFQTIKPKLEPKNEPAEIKITTQLKKTSKELKQEAQITLKEIETKYKPAAIIKKLPAETQRSQIKEPVKVTELPKTKELPKTQTEIVKNYFTTAEIPFVVNFYEAQKQINAAEVEKNSLRNFETAKASQHSSPESLPTKLHFRTVSRSPSAFAQTLTDKVGGKSQSQKPDSDPGAIYDSLINALKESALTNAQE